LPFQGICLYPIANHPGWENERHCYNGLLDYPDQFGAREVCLPLSRELKHQQAIFETLLDRETAAQQQYA
jgi:hypothetical protein